MKRRMMRRRKRSGISLLLLLVGLVPIAEAGKKKAAPESYALVAGTVFHEPGLALPGAEVTLIAVPEPGAPAPKVKKLQMTVDSRGEFAFRLPPAAMHYTVKVSAKGYAGEEKAVTLQGGEERIEVTFVLHEESK